MALPIGLAKKSKKREKITIALVPIPKLRQQLQTLVNRFVRLRDTNETGQGECISCGKPLHFKEMQAGHYLPRGNYPALRYNEQNLNGQCNGCNMFKRGNLHEYRTGLRKKIGVEEEQRLWASRHAPAKFTRDFYESKIAHYKLVNAELEKGKRF